MEKLEPLHTDNGIVKWCITKDKYFMHLHEVLRAVKFWEKQRGPVVAWGWGQGKWGVSVLIAPVQDEKSSGNWLYSNVQRVNNTDLYD